jgi:FAD synthase
MPANLPESVINALPKDLNTGIYYGWASLHGRVHKMVASIGWNPYYKNEKKSMVTEKRTGNANLKNLISYHLNFKRIQLL